MKAFLFWFQYNEDDPASYVYIIAYTLKQARYFWFNYLKYTIGHVSDYNLNPCDVINEYDFMRNHKVGDILGENAII